MRRARGGAVRRPGFTLVELLVVVMMVGVLARLTAIKLRPSLRSTVEEAGMQLVQDVDLARTRALAAGTMVRITFATPQRRYDGWLDHDRDGSFALTPEEQEALQATRTRTLPTGVTYGLGAAPAIPGDPARTSVPGTQLTFSGMGMSVNPAPVAGAIPTAAPVKVVYLRSVRDARAVVAVAVFPSGGIKLWRYQGTAWQ